METLTFIAESLMEAGSHKAAFYFAEIGMELCEYYKSLPLIGRLLLVLAKVSRKAFKYSESIIFLKKAL